jgi:hypothetical protein
MREEHVVEEKRWRMRFLWPCESRKVFQQQCLKNTNMSMVRTSAVKFSKMKVSRSSLCLVPSNLLLVYNDSAGFCFWDQSCWLPEMLCQFRILRDDVKETELYGTECVLWIVVFWVVMLCSLVDGDVHPQDGDDMFLRNAGNHLNNYTAS